MKSFFTKILVAWATFLLPAAPDAQNLLTDGDFSSTTSITPFYTYPVPLNTWCSWMNTGVVAQPEVVSGVCRYTISNAGGESWELQLAQWGFQLEKNYHYRLRFDAKADAKRTFGVFIGEDGGNWTNLNPNYLQYAADYWITFTIEFDAFSVFPLHKLSFEMGGDPSTMYFDNIILEKLGPATPPSIEMLGSAVPPYDWSAGVDLETSDGSNYILKNYTLVAGEVKFRQNHDWAINWGNSSFPTGFAYLNGPNIPVTAGTYDISFNRNSGEYRFTCISCPISIGIIGSSVPPYDWSTDLNMNSTDEINYSLKNVELRAGELRFRQNDDWVINWGGTTFPSGTGDISAPNLVIPAQGMYDIDFNRLTGAYEFRMKTTSISLIGSALKGWMEDVDLTSTDGVIYTLENQVFTAGEVKFRQDHDWAVNWGSVSFPFGYGVLNGPNIPVPAGTYSVTFNRLSGDYFFQIVCPEPVLTCKPDIVVNAAPDSCGATVFFDLPVPADSCGNPVVWQIGGQPSGSFFPVGTTVNSFLLVNDAWHLANCYQQVTVKDITPPSITGLSASKTTLWPANHKMVDVWIDYKVSDNCYTPLTEISVSSNEPQNGTGDGDTGPDWIILDEHHVQLRAERSGAGQGRVYSISVISTDQFGNSATATIPVSVPHDAFRLSANELSGQAPSDQAGGRLECSLSPNPSEHHFVLSIRSVSTEKIYIHILDGRGKVLRSMEAGNRQTIRLGEDLAPGIYLIDVKQGSEHRVLKAIKQ